MEYIDYYEILGVTRSATQEDIHRAYRQRARKFHPDVNKDKDAEAEFKKINEANEVLKDPEKRKLYDTYGKDWQNGAQHQNNSGWEQMFRQGSGQSGGGRTFRYSSGAYDESSGFSDFFHSLFGQNFSDHQTHWRDFDRAGRTHEADITLTLREIISGASKSISLQSYEYDGTGQPRPKTRNFQVTIPRGVTEGSVIRLPGQGEKGSGAGSPGDLLLRIHIAPDSKFSVEGYDLHTAVAIAPWEATLGNKIEIQTLEGSVSLKIPRGSQNGRKMRIRGKGLPRKNDLAGDIIVELHIRVPTSLSEEEEKLFSELAATSTFNPRKKMGQRAAGRDKDGHKQN
ncbi:MAG: DnaJ domain-containing protein [Desulfofustis sp.]|nr:DnaJ domain-containing protein [Desulfofustis sp.]